MMNFLKSVLFKLRHSDRFSRFPLLFPLGCWIVAKKSDRLIEDDAKASFRRELERLDFLCPDTGVGIHFVPRLECHFLFTLLRLMSNPVLAHEVVLGRNILKPCCLQTFY